MPEMTEKTVPETRNIREVIIPVRAPGTMHRLFDLNVADDGVYLTFKNGRSGPWKTSSAVC